MLVPPIHPPASPLRPSTYSYLRVLNSYGRFHHISTLLYSPFLPYPLPHTSRDTRFLYGSDPRSLHSQVTELSTIAYA